MPSSSSSSSINEVPQLQPTPQPPLAVGLIKFFVILTWSYLECAWRFAQRRLGIGATEVTGQIVVITGAAQGIGLATAELFAKQKCVTVLTDVSATVHDAARALSDQGYLTASYQLDVTDPASAVDCFQDVVKRFGRVDVLVSNAGVFQGRGLLELTESQVRSTIDVNLMGTIWVTRAVLPHMIKRRSGQIVSVVSMAACMGVAYCTDYSASKFGNAGFIEAVEDELRRMGLYGSRKIQLTMVCPTFLDPKAGGVLVNKRVKPGYGPSRLLTPRTVAEKILEAVQYRRRFICVPEALAVNFVARRLLPWRAARAFQDLDGGYFDAM